MEWDGQNSARELGEWLLGQIEEAARSTGILPVAPSVAPPNTDSQPLPPDDRAGDACEKTNDTGRMPVLRHTFPTRREFKGGDGKVLATVAGLQDALDQLKRLSRPFLNWAGKAERASFDVPTLPLFVHERLSTKAIIETLKGHRRAKEKQASLFELYGDPEHSIADQVLRAYEHRDQWTNRMILGDSLVVMNSLLHYENLGGQVQMIYMDPPYGVKFGSNFQPFVRRRDVKHNDDDDFTREPEMVQAYRDTWELGLHSYLAYLRERLLLTRELLAPSGSVFVQISDENLHHVRELMDEVFGAENLASVVTVKKTTSASSELLPTVSDFLLWYARDKERLKYRQTYLPKEAGGIGGGQYSYVEGLDGKRRPIGPDETLDEATSHGRLFCHDNLTSQRPPGDFPVEFEGRTFRPRKGYWKTGTQGMEKLKAARRLMVVGNTLRYVRFLSDFPVFPVTNLWVDTVTSGFDDPKVYVVQTNKTIVERCLLMTTDPGDLVLDPTCGSGTTAYVAEQWGRRWVTADVSRVPLALARQRLLTATFDWYELKDEARGPAGGFVYKRKQNKKGEEVGGIVPHITLKSIANNQPPSEEVLVDRPEVAGGITRVTGRFCVEATIPTPVDWEGDGVEDSAAGAAEAHSTFTERMLEILRKSPVLRLDKNKTVTLRNVRPPAKTLALSAEAAVDNGSSTGILPVPPGSKTAIQPVGTGSGHGQDARATAEKSGHGQDARATAEKSGHGQDARATAEKLVALVFGPENGAVSQKLVFEAAKEAYAKSYAHLYVIGFAIQPTARELIEKCAEVVGIPATYVQATPDLLMGDLLKNMRSSQIFSVCGLPEVEVKRMKDGQYQVKLLGLDVFDPVTMRNDTRDGSDVPCWLLDTDYNDLCFHVSQAFFPRTGAWENLKRALTGEYDESVWAHLAGDTSAPFEPGKTARSPSR